MYAFGNNFDEIFNLKINNQIFKTHLYKKKKKKQNIFAYKNRFVT